MNSQNGHNLSRINFDTGIRRQKIILSLDVYDESIFRTIYEQGEAVSKDEVSPLDLGQALSGLNTGTGILPPNVFFFRQSGDECQLGVYLPLAVRTLKKGTKAFTLPLPPLLFIGRGEKYFVYALNGVGWPEMNRPLYFAPLPNVHEIGKICRGSVQFLPTSPGTIYRAIDLFFDSHFNRDLSNGKSRKYPKDVTQGWAEVVDSGMDAYPLDDLVANGKKVEDLLNEAI